MARIIDGKAIALEMQEEMKAQVADLKARGIIPGLAAIMVGDDPASRIYVNNKEKDCQKVGIYSDVFRLPASTPEGDLIALVDELNRRSDIHGILIQLPIPKHLDEQKMIMRINPDKDVDGFHPVNVGKMVIGQPGFLPCTPYACQVLLERTGIETNGKHMVIVGRSNVVGKPLANIMLRKGKTANAIVTVCHTAADDLAYYTRQADILVAAVGRPRMVTGDMVKEGVVVIDVGITQVEDPELTRGTKMVGDVDFDSVAPKAFAITPVPGGVGPMTRTILLQNTIQSAIQFSKRVK